MPFCHECGASIIANAKFCPACGYQFQGVDGSPVTATRAYRTNQSAKPNNRTRNWLIGIAIAIFGGIPLLGIVAAIAIPGVLHYMEEDDIKSAHIELANVELSVAACMASPDRPIRDLTDDPRIASITQCNTEARNWLEVDDPEDESLTQDVTTLIKINPGPDVNPLTDFTNDDSFDNWYCVYDNGRVIGFTDKKPHQNIYKMDY